MDNWLLIELIARDRCDERRRELQSCLQVPAPEPRSRSRFRRRLASTLVRLGLVLDPGVGERLPSVDFSKSRPAASR